MSYKERFSNYVYVKPFNCCFIDASIVIRFKKSHTNGYLCDFFYLYNVYIMASIIINPDHTKILKRDFKTIIKLKLNIAKTIQEVNDKILLLKNEYNQLLQTNTKKIFLFCLDSLFSQFKSFSLELENIEQSKKVLNNRTYCDFYKLNNIIINYCKENKNDLMINDKLIINNFTIYKDLEPFQEYNLDDIQIVHSNILLLIDELYMNSVDKTKQIEDYNNNHNIGFTISNFINTLEHENALLKHEISLFMNYISFFHISQKKQLQRLLAKLEEFYKEVYENLDVNRTFSINNITDNIEDSDDEENIKLLVDEISTDFAKNSTLKKDTDSSFNSIIPASLVEVKPDEVKRHEVKPNEVKPDEVKRHEVKPDEVKLDEVKPDEVKPDEVKPDEVKPDEVK